MQQNAAFTSLIAMRIPLSLVLFTFCIAGTIRAQDPVASFTLLSDSMPAEHIYMQCNKDYYGAGETIWFKGYLFSRYNPSTLSANFYIELLNEDRRIVLSARFPVFAGTVTGSIDLPDTLSQGAYVLRAYTPWSLNFGDVYTYKKGIAIFNETTKPLTIPLAAEKKNCLFFPSGGILVAGLPNTVACRLFDSFMQPLIAAGKIVNDKGDEVAAFETDASGTGLFNFIPQKGETYTAELKFRDNSSVKYALPAAAAEGIVVDVFEKDGGKFFTVSATPGFENNKEELLLLAVVQNSIIANAKVKLINGNAEGSIDTRDLDPGFMQLLLFDKSGKLLAKANTFINAAQSSVKAAIRTDTVNFSPKGMNVFHLVFPDSVAGNFSLSVTDISTVASQYKSSNIISGLLLQPGSRSYTGYIPADAGAEEMERFSMTGDWPVNYPAMPLRFKDDPYIQVKGKVFKELRKDQQIKDALNIIVQTKDSSTAFFSVPLLPDDRFELKNLVYEDSARFYYQLNAKKNADKYLKIQLDSLPVPRPASNEDLEPWFNSCKAILADPIIEKKAKAIQQQYVTAKASGITLEEVVVKAKVLSREKQLNKEYTSGLFSGGIGARMIDVSSDAFTSGAQSIFQYLQGKIAGATIYYDYRNGRWVVESPRSYSTADVLAGGNGLVDGIFFVDEIETDAAFVERIPVNQVAFVKFFPPGSIMYPGVGISCVLAIYTKKGGDLLSTAPTYLSSFKFPGYTHATEFEMPDYSQELVKNPDYRTTLYWNPELMLDGRSKERRIVFYNSDNARKFRVILEGFTTKGELVHLEKIIDK